MISKGIERKIGADTGVVMREWGILLVKTTECRNSLWTNSIFTLVATVEKF